MKNVYDRNTKLRLLAVEQILNEKPLNASEIIDVLEKKYNVTADRKSIYDDIAVLTRFYNVQVNKRGYYKISF